MTTTTKFRTEAREGADPKATRWPTKEELEERGKADAPDGGRVEAARRRNTDAMKKIFDEADDGAKGAPDPNSDRKVHL